MERIRIIEVDWRDFDPLAENYPDAVGIPVVRSGKEIWPQPAQGWAVVWEGNTAFAVPE